jgi:hypothetical protein
MARIPGSATGLSLIASPAWADIAGTPSAGGGWPQWAVVAVSLTLFMGLIVVVSRFVRGDRKGGDDNDGGGLFGS